jgi:hypothetical protein
VAKEDLTVEVTESGGKPIRHVFTLGCPENAVCPIF